MKYIKIEYKNIKDPNYTETSWNILQFLENIADCDQQETKTIRVKKQFNDHFQLKVYATMMI